MVWVMRQALEIRTTGTKPPSSWKVTQCTSLVALTALQLVRDAGAVWCCPGRTSVDPMSGIVIVAWVDSWYLLSMVNIASALLKGKTE